MVITTLIALILISEAIRLFLAVRKTNKKQYFKDRLKGVDSMIWDLEFKRFKTQEIREDVRKVYAEAKSRLHKTEEDLKIAQEKGLKKDEGLGALEDQKVLLDRDISRYEAQLKQLDLDVEGSKKTAEFPDGVSGINDQLDSLREVKAMLADWIKGL